MTTIMGVRLDNRIETAAELQKILTQFGCIIKTRLGIHEADEYKCSHNGIIILDIINDEQVPEFEKELCKIEGIEIQKMVFN